MKISDLEYHLGIGDTDESREPEMGQDRTKTKIDVCDLTSGQYGTDVAAVGV